MNIVNSLNTINPANGLSTGFVNISAIPGLFNSLAFDPTDQLFGISRGGSAVGGLMAIDLGTETATLLGNSGIQNLSAIAFSMDVPEPTALSLFGFALAGLGVARRRRAS